MDWVILESALSGNFKGHCLLVDHSMVTELFLHCSLYVGIATHQRELKVGLDLDGRVGL